MECKKCVNLASLCEFAVLLIADMYSCTQRNINFFGLIFILTMSTIITTVDICLLRFLIYLKKSRQILSPRIDRWIQDDVFQLQRRAYEALGEGVWTRLENEIPVTIEDSLLPDLPIEIAEKRSEKRDERTISPISSDDVKPTDTFLKIIPDPQEQMAGDESQIEEGRMLTHYDAT